MQVKSIIQRKLFEAYVRTSGLLKEELSPDQKKEVDSWDNDNRAQEITGHIFEGDRMYIPLITKDVEIEAEPNPMVLDYLRANGFTVTPESYKNKQAIQHMPNGRERVIRIGKIVAKDANIKNAFDNDPIFAFSKKQAPLKVVITRNKYDVAGMSTDRAWRSCMNLNDGAYKEYVPRDIKAGTHVAYLIKSDDDDIKEPLARLSLKPYYSADKSVILVPEERTYGKESVEFRNTVVDWAVKSFDVTKSDSIYQHQYRKTEGVYNDGSPTTLFHPKTMQKFGIDDESYSDFRNSMSYYAAGLPEDVVMRVFDPDLVRSIPEYTIAGILSENVHVEKLIDNIVDRIYGNEKLTTERKDEIISAYVRNTKAIKSSTTDKIISYELKGNNPYFISNSISMLAKTVGESKMKHMIEQKILESDGIKRKIINTYNNNPDSMKFLQSATPEFKSELLKDITISGHSDSMYTTQAVFKMVEDGVVSMKQVLPMIKEPKSFKDADFLYRHLRFNNPDLIEFIAKSAQKLMLGNIVSNNPDFVTNMNKETYDVALNKLGSSIKPALLASKHADDTLLKYVTEKLDQLKPTDDTSTILHRNIANNMVKSKYAEDLLQYAKKFKLNKDLLQSIGQNLYSRNHSDIAKKYRQEVMNEVSDIAINNVAGMIMNAAKDQFLSYPDSKYDMKDVAQFFNGLSIDPKNLSTGFVYLQYDTHNKYYKELRDSLPNMNKEEVMMTIKLNRFDQDTVRYNQSLARRILDFDDQEYFAEKNNVNYATGVISSARMLLTAENGGVSSYVEKDRGINYSSLSDKQKTNMQRLVKAATFDKQTTNSSNLTNMMHMQTVVDAYDDAIKNQKNIPMIYLDIKTNEKLLEKTYELIKSGVADIDSDGYIYTLSILQQKGYDVKKENLKYVDAKFNIDPNVLILSDNDDDMFKKTMDRMYELVETPMSDIEKMNAPAFKGFIKRLLVVHESHQRARDYLDFAFAAFPKIGKDALESLSEGNFDELLEQLKLIMGEQGYDRDAFMQFLHSMEITVKQKMTFDEYLTNKDFAEIVKTADKYLSSLKYPYVRRILKDADGLDRIYTKMKKTFGNDKNCIATIDFLLGKISQDEFTEKVDDNFGYQWAWIIDAVRKAVLEKIVGDIPNELVGRGRVLDSAIDAIKYAARLSTYAIIKLNTTAYESKLLTNVIISSFFPHLDEKKKEDILDRIIKHVLAGKEIDAERPEAKEAILEYFRNNFDAIYDKTVEMSRQNPVHAQAMQNRLAELFFYLNLHDYNSFASSPRDFVDRQEIDGEALSDWFRRIANDPKSKNDFAKLAMLSNDRTEISFDDFLRIANKIEIAEEFMNHDISDTKIMTLYRGLFKHIVPKLKDHVYILPIIAEIMQYPALPVTIDDITEYLKILSKITADDLLSIYTKREYRRIMDKIEEYYKRNYKDPVFEKLGIKNFDDLLRYAWTDSDDLEHHLKVIGKEHLFMSQAQTKTYQEPTNDIMTKAKQLGLTYYKWGRFGKEINGKNTVTHIVQDGRLVPKIKQLREGNVFKAREFLRGKYA